MQGIGAEERIEDVKSMSRVFVDLSMNWVYSSHLLLGGIVPRGLVRNGEPLHLVLKEVNLTL